MIYFNNGNQNLSEDLKLEDVRADDHRRKLYYGQDTARQFDLSLQHVLDMVDHMYKRYDTVSCFSMGLLEPGMMIYYLESYTVGSDRVDQECGTVRVGGNRFDARVRMKGRFGIVVKKYEQFLQVAQMYTFGNRGLGSKPPKSWNEYVEVRTVDNLDDHSWSDNKPLEIAQSCCDILPTSWAHLVTNKVSLSDQILCAGSITPDSLERMRDMIKAMT